MRHYWDGATNRAISRFPYMAVRGTTLYFTLWHALPHALTITLNAIVSVLPHSFRRQPFCLYGCVHQCIPFRWWMLSGMQHSLDILQTAGDIRFCLQPEFIPACPFSFVEGSRTILRCSQKFSSCRRCFNFWSYPLWTKSMTCTVKLVGGITLILTRFSIWWGQSLLY